MFDPENPFGRWQQFELDNLFRGSLLAMGIVKGNPDLVRRGLDRGEDPNSRYSYEKDNNSINTPNPVCMITPIVQAAVIGSLPIMRLLVERGADVNICQLNGESALANAANRGDVELVRYLLEHGADPNLRKSFGTPLAMADGPVVMRALLDYGADPNIADDDGDLPIIGSIDTKNLEEVRLLICYGTDMEHANNSGETPLDRAKRRGIYDSVSDFVQNVERKEPNHIPELSRACFSGDFALANSLLSSGADPNELSSDGKTPLFYCAEVAFVCLLEHYGADLNAADSEGNTPIFHFLEGENINANGWRAIVFLIQSGANVDIKNHKGISPRDVAESITDHELQGAFRQGFDNFDRKRRAYQRNIAEQNSNRSEWYAEHDPLKPAPNWERAIANCFNACALSDLDVLKANEDFVRENLTVLISSENTNSRNMLMVACADASSDIVEYLLSLGANPNCTDNTGQAALRYAAISWRDSARKIDALVKAGADVNHASNDGSAALSDAAYAQNVEAARALIMNGADVNNRDSQGYTALSWTCGKGVPEAEIVELLLREGGDVRDLYNMNCVLRYLDYEHGYMNGIAKEYFLRPRDLKVRHLYEHALIPGLVSREMMHRFMD